MKWVNEHEVYIEKADIDSVRGAANAAERELARYDGDITSDEFENASDKVGDLRHISYRLAEIFRDKHDQFRVALVRLKFDKSEFVKYVEDEFNELTEILNEIGRTLSEMREQRSGDSVDDVPKKIGGRRHVRCLTNPGELPCCCQTEPKPLSISKSLSDIMNEHKDHCCRQPDPKLEPMKHFYGMVDILGDWEDNNGTSTTSD